MANRNPYITDPNLQEEDVLDKTAGFVKGASVAARTPGMVAAMGNVFNSVKANTLTSWIPDWLGGGVGESLGEAAKTSAGNSAGNLFNTGFLGKAFAGVTAATRGVQAIQEYADGDVAEGTGKLVRGATEAAVILANFSGLFVMAELASKLVTGKFISTHVGDLTENMTTGLLGGTKEEKEAKQIKEARSAGLPAAAVAVPGGIAAAGLAAHHFMQPGQNEQLTVGGLPPANKTQIDGAQVLPNQVMPASYSQERAREVTETAQRDQAREQQQAMPAAGMPPGYWQSKVAEQRGGRGASVEQGGAAPAASSAGFVQGISHAEAIDYARQQAAMQGSQLTT